VLLPLEALDLRRERAGALGDEAAQLRRLALQLGVGQRLEPLLVAMIASTIGGYASALAGTGSEDLGEPTLVHQSSIRDTAVAAM